MIVNICDVCGSQWANVSKRCPVCHLRGLLVQSLKNQAVILALVGVKVRDTVGSAIGVSSHEERIELLKAAEEVEADIVLEVGEDGRDPFGGLLDPSFSTTDGDGLPCPGPVLCEACKAKLPDADGDVDGDGDAR